MIKRQCLLPFDLFQQMVDWLSSSQYSSRKGRHYLEQNLELLQMEADREMVRLVRAHCEDEQETQQLLRDHLYLIRDARGRGATPQAVRAAYVNMYGGLSLELPAWLDELEKRRSLLLKLRRPDRTCRTHIQLLRGAIIQAHQELVPEITAELLNELGYLLVQSPHYSTQQQRLQAIEEAMHCHKMASDVFTASTYPLQHAHTAFHLGNACYHYARAGYYEAAKHALACYDTALRIYTCDDFPIQWATLQTSKGRVYTLPGYSQQHLELACACHKAALRMVCRESASCAWADIQINLGDACRLCSTNEQIARGDSLRKAMSCYRAALEIYTPATAAREWADVHTRLAAAYQCCAQDVRGDREQQDKYLRCAIVCCEGALQTYSPDSYPVEHAATQVCLGQLHRSRPAGDCRANLEQACACYRHALRIFTSMAFPQDYRRVLLALRITETRLKALRQGASPAPRERG